MDIQPSDVIAAIGVIVALISAVIGGAIAGGAAWLATWQQGKLETARRKQEAKDKVDALLSAMYHELTTVWEIYMDAAGGMLEQQQGGMFAVTVNMADDYYLIYDANIQSLGTIPTADLRIKIITAYTYIKGLRDVFAFNDSYLEKVAAAGATHAIHKTFETAKVVNDMHPVLIETCGKLKLNHMRTKQAVVELTTLLKPYSAK